MWKTEPIQGSNQSTFTVVLKLDSFILNLKPYPVMLLILT